MRTIGEKVSPPTLFLGISRSGACGGARGARLAGLKRGASGARLGCWCLAHTWRFGVARAPSPDARLGRRLPTRLGCWCLAQTWRFGVARAPSPDARCGHPWPPLARTRLRFALRAALVGYAGSRSTGDPSLAALGVGAGRWAEGSCRASRSGFDFFGHAEDFVEARDPAEDLLDAVVEHHPHPVGTRGAADVLRGGPLEGELADLAAHHHQFEDP